VPTSPPVAFPLYGLDASWPGARWLNQFGDEIGDPPRWLTLAHESADGQSLIMVTTYSRAATDAAAAQWGQSAAVELASDAAHMLIDVTLPAQSVPRPDGFLPLLTEHAMKIADQHPHWTAVRWQVDGTATTAHGRRFAGGWAAVGDLAGDVYLTAVGVGTGPEGLSLARLRDGGAYHFDLAQPLNPPVMTASRKAAGVQFDEPGWRQQDWHADQLRLIREPRRGAAE
jgi:hypothetical protein